jgi:hypothetical protein
MDEERQGPLLLVALLESRRLVDPSHDLVAIISFEPKLFSLQTIKTTIDMLGRERGQAMQLSVLGVRVLG